MVCLEEAGDLGRFWGGRIIVKNPPPLSFCCFLVPPLLIANPQQAITVVTYCMYPTNTCRMSKQIWQTGIQGKNKLMLQLLQKLRR